MSRATPRFRRLNPSLPSLSTSVAMRIQLGGLIDNQMWLTDMDYINVVTTTPNVAAEANLASAWITACGTQFKAIMSSDTIWNFIKVACLTIPTRQPFVSVNLAGLGNGTVVATHIPNEMAGIISKYTAFKGQHGRGRNYFTGVPATFITPAADANHLNATGTTAYQALATQMITTISDGTNPYAIGITQRTRGGAAATNGAVIPNIGGLVIKTLLGTVRRRRVGRGK